ncbi:MAG: DUF4810 domain-containing protein [Bacteroidales bacterium]|nr:DUF4810 domain-containing protein [Bacteroidales bacterium]
MKRYLFFSGCLALVMMFVSCSKDIYSYKDYDEAAYTYTTSNDLKDIKRISKSYEKIVTDKGAKKKNKFDETRIPPGACIDYAYLKLQQQDTNSAYSFLEKEVSLYPESRTYVENLKKKLGL